MSIFPETERMNNHEPEVFHTSPFLILHLYPRPSSRSPLLTSAHRLATSKPFDLRFYNLFQFSTVLAITESDSAPVTMTPDSKSMEKMLEKLLILDFARQGFVAPGAFGTGNDANPSTSISQLGVATLSFGMKSGSGGSK